MQLWLEQWVLFITKIYDVPFFTQVFSYSLALVIVQSRMVWNKKHVWETVKRILVLTLIITLLCSIAYSFFGSLLDSKYAFLDPFDLSFLIVGGTYTFLFGRPHIISSSIKAASLFVTLELIIMLSGSISLNFARTVTDYTHIEIIVVRMLPYLLLIPLSVSMQRYDIKTYEESLTGIFAGFQLAICVLILIITSVNKIRRFDSTEFAFQTVVSCCLAFVELIFYFMSYTIVKEKAEHLELQAEKHLEQAEKELVAFSEKSLGDLRHIRHDIKNQYLIMKVMLEEERYEDLKSYFEEIGGAWIRPNSGIDCGNRTISAVLNMELSKAEVAGVKLETRLFVPPELPFKNVDLSSLLSNLVDNAIEACLAEQIVDPYVIVTIVIKGDYFYFSVHNPTKKEKNKYSQLSLDSTKKDTKYHGYGTKIVNRIVDKYHGTICYDIVEHIFKVDGMLDLYF